MATHAEIKEKAMGALDPEVLEQLARTVFDGKDGPYPENPNKVGGNDDPSPKEAVLEGFAPIQEALIDITLLSGPGNPVGFGMQDHVDQYWRELHNIVDAGGPDMEQEIQKLTQKFTHEVGVTLDIVEEMGNDKTGAFRDAIKKLEDINGVPEKPEVAVASADVAGQSDEFDLSSVTAGAGSIVQEEYTVNRYEGAEPIIVHEETIPDGHPGLTATVHQPESAPSVSEAVKAMEDFPLGDPRDLESMRGVIEALGGVDSNVAPPDITIEEALDALRQSPIGADHGNPEARQRFIDALGGDDPNVEVPDIDVQKIKEALEGQIPLGGGRWAGVYEEGLNNRNFGDGGPASAAFHGAVEAGMGPFVLGELETTQHDPALNAPIAVKEPTVQTDPVVTVQNQSNLGLG